MSHLIRIYNDEPPHQDLQCLQIYLVSSLALKELRTCEANSIAIYRYIANLFQKLDQLLV